ncbi:MAG: 50S ribosomal protein L11 methyltransferase [Polyangiaceae bacterium]|nr:50S ribosomal protein L11 methyltransferase [Polyangiaceae bacterium]
MRPRASAAGAGVTSLYVLTVDVAAADSDATAAALFAAGVGGLEEKTAGATVRLIAYAESQEAIESYRHAVLRWTAQSRVVARIEISHQGDVQWRTAWTHYLRPEPVGDSFVLQPAWDDSPAPPGRSVLRFDPAMTFGVGSHPTTRLAATAVERECRHRSGARLLDVGTGTGVLAMIGAASGAGQVVGLDVDPTSVCAAARNAGLNGLHDCTFLQIPVAELAAVFDVVVANMELGPLLALAEALVGHVDDGGRLLVTGFLQDRLNEVERVFSRLGLRVTGAEHDEPWALVSLSRP